MAEVAFGKPSLLRSMIHLHSCLLVASIESRHAWPVDVRLFWNVVSNVASYLNGNLSSSLCALLTSIIRHVASSQRFQSSCDYRYTAIYYQTDPSQRCSLTL